MVGSPFLNRWVNQMSLIPITKGLAWKWVEVVKRQCLFMIKFRVMSATADNGTESDLALSSSSSKCASKDAR